MSMVNLPNFLTSLRILLIPVFILIFTVPSPARPFLSALIFLTASLTDFFDGYIARRQAQITKLGKLLDPVADKLLISSALILLVSVGRVPAWIVIVIIARELIVTGLRAVASTEGIVLASEPLGKIKFFFQICAVLLLLLGENLWSINLYFWGNRLLELSAVFAILSGGQYCVEFWKQLNIKGMKW
jgi:CDP-diacylglycerol--glycerol-3-phosphate 3-phosphatidyltransferase